MDTDLTSLEIHYMVARYFARQDLLDLQICICSLEYGRVDGSLRKMD